MIFDFIVHKTSVRLPRKDLTVSGFHFGYSGGRGGERFRLRIRGDLENG